MDSKHLENSTKIDDLPDEIIKKIFWYLPQPDLQTHVRLVSKRWNAVSEITAPSINFLRLVDLTIRIGQQAVRQVFEPKLYFSRLLKGLPSERIFIGIDEYNKMLSLHYPTGGDPTSLQKIDISLMVCVLRNCMQFQINDHDSPRTYTNDASKDADISRIIFYRNQIVNSKDWVIGQHEFTDIWSCVSGAIWRLAPNLYPEVQKLESIPLDRDKLKQLKKHEELLESTRKLALDKFKKHLEFTPQDLDITKNQEKLSTRKAYDEGMNIPQASVSLSIALAMSMGHPMPAGPMGGMPHRMRMPEMHGISGLLNQPQLINWMVYMEDKFGPIQIPYATPIINLGIFSSTSYLESILNSNGLDTPCITLCCYTRDRAILKQLPYIDELSNFNLYAATDMQNRPSTNNLYIRVVVLERDNTSKGGRGTQAVNFNERACSILRGFSVTYESFENSIFVLDESYEEYSLETASKEIANFLKVDNREVFKRLFHFKDGRIEERVEACLVQILITLIERQTDGLPKQTVAMLHPKLQAMKDAVRMHEFKTVALRHEAVSRFGRSKNSLKVILKKEDIETERDVRQYLQEFVGAPPDGYKLVVEFRDSCIHMPIEITNINLGIFTSTSYLESTLRSNGIDTSFIKFYCYIRDSAMLKKLPSLDKLANLYTCAETDTWNKSTTDNLYLRFVVLEPDIVSQDGKDTQAVSLSKTDCAILRGFKDTSESFENSIFVLNKSEKEYDLNAASVEISKFLHVDNRDIFKRLFDSKDKRLEERVEACLIQILTTMMESQKGDLPQEKADMLDQEIESGKFAVQIHEYETVALRHEAVSRFGRSKNSLKVILKKEDIETERDVRQYLQEFVGAPPDGYKLFVEFRDSCIHMPIEITNINLGIFTSTSYLESTLRSNGIDTSFIKFYCYIRDRAMLKKLPSLDELANLDTGAETDLRNKSTAENLYLRFVVLEPDIVSQDGKDTSTQAVSLSKTDCSILRSFKDTSESFEYSIFVLNKSEKEYDLNAASVEISKFLHVDNRDIFKRLFDSKDERLEERVEACLIQILTTMMESQKGDLPKEKADMLDQEIESGKYAVQIHEYETVALRHGSVNGFGWYKNRLSVFLKKIKKKEMEKEKKSLHQYLKEFVGNLPDGFELVVEYRERQIEKLADIKQGSEVNSHHPTTIDIGTLGMFLRDETDTYFTTCAHVIEKKHKAYSQDGSKIGESVLAIDGPITSTSSLDFSLVKIFPEITVNCDLGIRRRQLLGGYFDNGIIYKGNNSFFKGKILYKYGATVDYAETRCQGTETHDNCLFLHVDTEGFSEKGDSGCLISFEANRGEGWAVFVLVAVDKKTENCYQVCKVRDAIDYVKSIWKQPIDPCLKHETVTIPKILNNVCSS